MSREESLKWFEKTAKGITKLKVVQDRLKICVPKNIVFEQSDNRHTWYLKTCMPIIGEVHGYTPGEAVLLSLNAELGQYDVIKPGLVCCIWMWISVAGKYIDSASVYFDKTGESYVSTLCGELTLVCLQQCHGAFEAFCIDYFNFFLPSKTVEHFVWCQWSNERGTIDENGNLMFDTCDGKEKYLKEHPIDNSWESEWHYQSRVDYYEIDNRYDLQKLREILPPPREDYLVTTRKLEDLCVEVSDEWFKKFMKRGKKLKREKNSNSDMYFNLAHNPMTIGLAMICILFGGVGGLPGILIILIGYIAAYFALALCVALYNLIFKDKTKDRTPYTFPEELKELAYLRMQGWNIPTCPPTPKGTLKLSSYGRFTRLFGYMEEIKNNEYGLTESDVHDLRNKTIPSPIAAKLGMGSCMGWDDCYHKLTEWKIEDYQDL